MGLRGAGASTNGAPGTTLTYATGGFNALVVDNWTICTIDGPWQTVGLTCGQYTITGHTDTTLTLGTSPGASLTGLNFCLANTVGITDLTAGNMAVAANAGIAMSGTLVYSGNGQTTTFGNGASLTGFSANVAYHQGSVTWGNGCVYAGAKAGALGVGYPRKTGNTFAVNGTSAAVTRITNLTAGQNAYIAQYSDCPVILTHTNLDGYIVDSYGNYFADFVQLAPKLAAGVIQTTDGAKLLPASLYNHIWVTGVEGATVTGTVTAAALMPPSVLFSNIALGYTRYGVGTTLTNGIASRIAAHIHNCIINATTPVEISGAATGVNLVSIDNFGYVDPAMVAGGSALAAAVVAPGVSKTWSALGTFERSTANPRSGTYNGRSTPASIVSATLPLDMSVYVPVTTGQNVSVSGWASRHTLTSTSAAQIVIDPEKAWFDTTGSSAEALTNADTYYNLTCSATSARTGTGKCRIVLRCRSYTAAGYLDWDDISITVGTQVYTVNFADWALGGPEVNLANLPAVGDVESGVTFGVGNALEGTFAAPAESQALAGVGFGADGTEFLGNYVTTAAGDVEAGVAFGPSSSLSGTFAKPTESQTLDGIGFGEDGTEFLGNYVVTAAGDVEAGVMFGPSASIPGTFVKPAESQTLAGVGFGADGTEFLGNYVTTAAGDVEAGVAFGPSSSIPGTFLVPPVARVEDGFWFGEDGTEFEGSLVGGGASYLDPAYVAAGVDRGDGVPGTFIGVQSVTTIEVPLPEIEVHE